LHFANAERARLDETAEQVREKADQPQQRERYERGKHTNSNRHRRDRDHATCRGEIAQLLHPRFIS